MNHIPTDRLREYKFDLLSAAENTEIAAHLEHCPDCQKKFQSLEAQFQSLEVLRDQPEASNDFIAQIVDATPSSRHTRKVILFRPIAILAAAASIAFAFMLIRPDGQSDERTAGFQPALRESRLEAGGTPSLAELRATQPFAPASNIELNVLPRRDEVQLSIYNAEDLTLVREKRKMTLKRGWNWLQFMWSETLIDPTSLELTPVSHADRIEITQLVFPARLNELARWTIFSEVSGEAEFELTYLTSGLKWNANYEATLAPDELTLQLKSRIRVDNHSGEDYENAQTRLVVGKINIEDTIKALAERTYPFGTPPMGGFSLEPPTFGFTVFGRVGFDGMAKRKKITKKRLSEYQLYTIEGRETIPDGWGKRLPNFEAQEIGVTNLYKFEQERWGDQTMRFLSFANTEACQLGETPLPEGQVRVFKVDAASSRVAEEGLPGACNEAGSLVYTGTSLIQYIPVGEEVELELGAAEKVTVEPSLMRTRSENFEFDAKGNVAGWDEITDWEIEITNTRDLPVELEIMRWTGSNHWKLQTGATFEKYDANHFKFNVQVEAQSKHSIKYELSVHHGVNREE